MWFDELLKNILYYFLPIAVTWTLGVLALAKLEQRQKRRLLVAGILILLILVVVISLFTRPPEEDLHVELAFYALTEQPNTTYKLQNLLGERPPTHLGVRDPLGQVKGLPMVNSGDELQLRLKLNRKGYVYVFHFDTTALELRPLFPSQDVRAANPVPGQSWLELPAADETWSMDDNPGLEAFVVLASATEQNEISVLLQERVAALRGAENTNRLAKLQTGLFSLGSYFPVGTGELAHGLPGTSPAAVTTRTVRGSAEKEKTVLFWQLVRHQ